MAHRCHCTIAELFRLIQTQNILYLALAVSAILLAIVYAVALNGLDSSLGFPLATLIMIIISTYLLSIWVRSMSGHLQKKYRQYFFRFIQVCLVLLTLIKLAEFIFYLPHVTRAWREIRYSYEIFAIGFIIEFAIMCFLELFCIITLQKLQEAVDPDFILKRRQLIWIILMYLAQGIHLACSAVSSIVNDSDMSLFTEYPQKY
jgi:hypothetical protein